MRNTKIKSTESKASETSTNFQKASIAETKNYLQPEGVAELVAEYASPTIADLLKKLDAGSDNDKQAAAELRKFFKPKRMDKSRSLNYADSYGETLLHMAIVDWSLTAKSIKALIDAGCNIEAKDFHQQTPLIRAARGCIFNHDFIQLLIDAKAKVDERDADGVTALIHAAMGDQPNNLDILIKAGANLEAQTANGMTALFAAVAEDRVENVKLLLDAGAKPNHKDKKGKTPLDYANEKGFYEKEKEGNKEIVRLLEQAQNKKTNAPDEKIADIPRMTLFSPEAKPADKTVFPEFDFVVPDKSEGRDQGSRNYNK